MFFISEYYDEFTKITLSSYKENDIKKALSMHFSHPNLVRRLVSLKKEGATLSSILQNPWHDEMVRCNIKPEYIAIIEKYLKFKQKKQDEAYADFKKQRRDVNAISASYTRLPSNHLKLNLKSTLSATEVNADISEGEYSNS